MKRILSVMLALAVALTCQAQRPKVGLVLCGGGAKGAAHIGVLKVLEENAIPVDYIAGTSMGAIIGGLYAIGYSASEIDSLIYEQDWSLVMSDKVPRGNKSFEDRQYDNKYVLKIPFSIGHGALLADARDSLQRPPHRRPGPEQEGSILDKVPLAVTNGQNVYNLFTSLSIGYQDSLDFNNMPIPFACVAVDLISRKEVVFRSGNFVDAIRSSMAIPGYFAPVRKDGMVLVDGGALNNFPVDVVRDMGADVIIGVKLGKDEESKGSDVNNIGDLVNDVLDLYMLTKYDDAIAATDVLIQPSVKGFSTMSFDSESLRTLISNGVAAAREKEPELKALREYLDRCEVEEDMNLVGPKYVRKKYKKAVNISADTLTLGHINFSGVSADHAQLLFRKSKLKSGARISGFDIEKEISKFYNTTAFESVTYVLKGQEEPYDMDINFRPGHNSQFGLGFRVDNEEVAVIQMRVDINRSILYGSSLALTGKLSYNPTLSVKYSYSLPSKVQLGAEYCLRSTNSGHVADYAMNSLSFLSNTARVYFSTRKIRSIYLESGFEYSNYFYGNRFSDDNPYYGTDTYRRNFADVYAKALYNSLDDEYYPTRGWILDGSFSYHFGWFAQEEAGPFAAAYAHFSKPVGMGRHFALIPTIYGRALFGGDVPLVLSNIMGGYMQGRYVDQQIPFMGLPLCLCIRGRAGRGLARRQGPHPQEPLHNGHRQLCAGR